jgi:hypothetical protein
MAKYTYEIHFGNGETFRGDEEMDEIFDSEEEAEEAGWQALSDMDTGAEVLNLSNPGDYPYDENQYNNDDIEVEVIKL